MLDTNAFSSCSSKLAPCLDSQAGLRHPLGYDKPNNGVGGSGGLNADAAAHKGQILPLRKEIDGIRGAADPLHRQPDQGDVGHGGTGPS